MAPVTRSRYKTTNLTLASFLAYRNQPYRLVRGEGKIATWEFDQDAVSMLVMAFDEGAAAVEPRAFHHAITKTRRLLFDFLAPGVKAPIWDEDQIAERLATKK